MLLRILHNKQVLALRGNRVPRNFLPIVDELLAKQVAGTLMTDNLARLAAPPASVTNKLTGKLDPIRKQVRSQLDRSLNEDLGSWRSNGARVDTARGAQASLACSSAASFGFVGRASMSCSRCCVRFIHS